MTCKGSYKSEKSIKESQKYTNFKGEFDMGSLEDVKEGSMDDDGLEDDDYVIKIIKSSQYFIPLTRMMTKERINS
jgi:hypothetical protein